MVPFVALPSDVLILILENLNLSELVAFAQCCSLLSGLVREYGWSAHLRKNPRPTHSFSRTTDHWDSMARARYNAVTDRAWPMFKFVARPLSKPWHGKFQPVLAINGSRLVVAAGNYLDVYHFVDSVGLAAPGIRREGSISLQGTHQRKRDITAVTFVEDQGQDRTLYVAYQDGGLDLVILRPPSKARDELGHKSVNSKMITPTEIRTIKAGNNENIVEDDYTGSLSSQNGLVVSLSSNGTSQLVDNQTHATVSCPLELGCRGWTCYASLNSSTPFVAFGTSSRTPLTIYSINNLELSPSPIAILARDTSTLSAPTNSSAVYGICQAPLGAPWGASPQVIASGWFDGQVRVYDMRASHRQSAVRKNASESSSTSTSAPLLPVLSLADPWSYDPIYSVSSGGGSSAYIAAGSARHSVVAFWDVRSPKSTAGWSVHAPGNDPSPVYSVILESSRLFGVTQSRPFVYDFGPGTSLDTYPPLPDSDLGHGLKLKKHNVVSYSVTRYKHIA